MTTNSQTNQINISMVKRTSRLNELNKQTSQQAKLTNEPTGKRATSQDRQTKLTTNPQTKGANELTDKKERLTISQTD